MWGFGVRPFFCFSQSGGEADFDYLRAYSKGACCSLVPFPFPYAPSFFPFLLQLHGIFASVCP